MRKISPLFVSDCRQLFVESASFRVASVLLESALRERFLEKALSASAVAIENEYENVCTVNEIKKIVCPFAVTNENRLKITITVAPELTYVNIDKKLFLSAITIMVTSSIKNIENIIQADKFQHGKGTITVFICIFKLFCPDLYNFLIEILYVAFIIIVQATTNRQQMAQFNMKSLFEYEEPRNRNPAEMDGEDREGEGEEVKAIIQTQIQIQTIRPSPSGYWIQV